MIRRRNMEQRKTFGVLRDIKNGEFRVVLTPAEACVRDGDHDEVGELGARFCGRLPYGIMIYSFGFVDWRLYESADCIRNKGERICRRSKKKRNAV
jgi:hypothetical protein